MIALADEDVVAVPAKRFALRSVAPAHDRAAARERADRQVVEAQDVCDARALAAHRTEPGVDARMNPRLSVNAMAVMTARHGPASLGAPRAAGCGSLDQLCDAGGVPQRLLPG
jgi:hypothetical protein